MDLAERSLSLFAVHEARMLSLGTRQLPVPVLLVSGSLGSGKTTLLNHILHNKLNLRGTCLVNDLAAQNIDAALLVARDEARKTVHLSNGCACHTLSGEFEEAMWEVLQETDGSDQTDYVVIETSGVADPVGLVQRLERRYGKMTRARLDGVAVVVDADLLASQLHEPHAGDAVESPEAARRALVAAAGPALGRQLACADVVVLNKCDLLAEEAAARTAARVQWAAPWAAVHRCERGRLPLHLLLNVELVHSGAAAGAPGHEARLIAHAGGFVTGGAAPAAAAAAAEREARLAAAASDGERAAPT